MTTRLINYMKTIFSQWKNPKKEQEQIEDILKAIYHGEDQNLPIDISSLCNMAQINEKELPSFLDKMVSRGLISQQKYKLTDEGKRQALYLIRRHRLYETYLSKYSGHDAKKWHELAETKEHHMSANETEKLNRILKNPLFDPHGDPIPRKDSLSMPQKPLNSIDEIKVGDWIIVDHIEDDDNEKYISLLNIGISKGVLFHIEKINTLYIEIFLEGDIVNLRRDLISALDIRIATKDEVDRLGGKEISKLTSLKDDETAIIHTISPACTGLPRRRLMDLGFVNGSEVIVDVHSPMGNPTAYLIRGSAIALREDQSDYILIKNKRKQDL